MTDETILAIYRYHRNWSATARETGRSRHRVKLAVRRAVIAEEAEAEARRVNGGPGRPRGVI